MNLVDSSGWIEYFVGGRNASFFAEAIEDVERLLVPTICLLEVYRFLLRRANRTEALRAVSAMHSGRVVSLDSGLAMRAANLGVTKALPLADSIIYATAKRHGAIVWTQDVDFRDLEQVRFVAAKK